MERHLYADRSKCGLDDVHSTWQHEATRRADTQPKGRRFSKERGDSVVSVVRAHQHADDRGGASLLHGGGKHRDVERALGHECLGEVAKPLAAHVIDIRLDLENLVLEVR